MGNPYNIQRYKTSLVLAFATDANSIKSGFLPFNGLLRGVIINAPALEVAHTYTINIEDADGNVIYTKGSLTQNQVTQIYLYDANNALAVPLSGNHKIEIVTSGDQTANRTFSIALLIDKG